MEENNKLIQKLIKAEPGDVFEFIANTNETYDLCKIEVISKKEENPTWTVIQCKPFGIDFWTTIDIYQYQEKYCVRFSYRRMKIMNKPFCVNSIEHASADFYLTPWMEAYKKKYQELLNSKKPHESFDILTKKFDGRIILCELYDIIEGLKLAYKALTMELEGALLFKRHQEEAAQ